MERRQFTALTLSHKNPPAAQKEEKNLFKREGVQLLSTNTTLFIAINN
jgi:hypothetical protein